MITDFFVALGPWNWWILALLLIGLEIIAPGTFFLWFGISAFVIGTIALAVGPETTFFIWQTQVVSFAILALAAAYVGRRFMNQHGVDEGEISDLNDRAAQLVGRSGVVRDAITGGQGRIQLGETTWRAKGPDLPAGTAVRVVDHKSGFLVVEAERTA